MKENSSINASHEIFGILEVSAMVSNFIWNQLPMILMITDENGRVLKANKASCRFLKLDIKKVIGEKVQKLFAASPTHRYFEEFFSEPSKDYHRPSFQSYIDSSSEYIFWQIKFLSSKSDNELIYAIVGHNTEEFRQAYQGEIIKSSTLTSIATLAGGVAHELNNPLTIVKGCSDLIERLIGEKGSKQKLQKLTSEINTHIDRMAKIIKHLRSFSTTTPFTELYEINVNLPIKKAIDFYQSTLHHEKINVLLKLADNLSILGNEQEIESAIHILILNSRHALEKVAAHTKREIKISTYIKHQNVLIEFSDNGSGIDPKVIDRIFDPFFTTKEVGKGTGLGLSRLYNTIQVLEGNVEVESIPNTKTTFKLIFPRFKKNSKKNAQVEK